MPRRSQDVGFRCTAFWPNERGELSRCSGLMSVGGTRHPRDNGYTARICICPLCGSHQTTVEKPAGVCRKPAARIALG